MNEINKKSQSRYARCPEVRYRYCQQNRACVSFKIVKHHLRSCLHLLLFVRFVQHNLLPGSGTLGTDDYLKKKNDM
jgi:hypothetical protein